MTPATLRDAVIDLLLRGYTRGPIGLDFSTRLHLAFRDFTTGMTLADRVRRALVLRSALREDVSAPYFQGEQRAFLEQILAEETL